MTDGLDYSALGFRCGLEIHQQVSGSKLFCRCPADVPAPDDERPDVRAVRRLRPTQSELGEVDAAAVAESRRARLFEYRGMRSSCCLVDLDEEPPSAAAPGALDVALTMALLLGSRPADEIQWMRKIVIDGSNTTGFQRTGLIARGGKIDDVTVETICLEEDSARRIRDEPDRVVWGLDRLGVPLIEIATAPEIRDGEHARRVAASLGSMLRSTGRVQRGLGTIRQDLNVSVHNGQRVEVKGVQELNAIPKVIEWEVRRHLRILEVAAELKKRGVGPEAFTYKPTVAAQLFATTEAKFLRTTLEKGGTILGHRLQGFHGLIGAARKEDPRLGRELAGYAKRDGGVQGILHGDELPGMGISQADVEKVRSLLSCAPHDSFVLVAAAADVADRTLRIVVDRAGRALQGVLPEVRMAEPDHSTSYLRPMPGSARMYPETDVPPNPVTAERVARLRAELPPPHEVQVARVKEKFRVSQDEANQLVRDGLVADLESLASGGDASLAARVLLQFVPDLERRFPAPSAQLTTWARAALDGVRAGRFAKEGLPMVLEALASGQAASLDAAIAKAGLASVDTAAVEARAKALVDERLDFVKSRGRESVGPLMGVLMKEFRGKVDGGVLNQVLMREIDRRLNGHG